MTNYLSGDAAERMINYVSIELGFRGESPVEFEQVFDEMNDNINYHFEAALSYILEEAGSYNVGVMKLLDRAFAIDGFIEDNKGNLWSYDVTTNYDISMINHKYKVQDIIKVSKKRLGLPNHLIIFLKSEVSFRYLTIDQKYHIMDKLMEACEKGGSLREVSIKV